jgi:hypothetical protein
MAIQPCTVGKHSTVEVPPEIEWEDVPISKSDADTRPSLTEVSST